MDAEDEFDIVVIGGGPGGYATALYAAAAGMSVAIVERDKVGGTCLHRGCVPAKEFLETAAIFRTVGSAADFGIKVAPPTLEFSVSQDRKNAVVDKPEPKQQIGQSLRLFARLSEHTYLQLRFGVLPVEVTALLAG